MTWSWTTCLWMAVFIQGCQASELCKTGWYNDQEIWCEYGCCGNYGCCEGHSDSSSDENVKLTGVGLVIGAIVGALTIGVVVTLVICFCVSACPLYKRGHWGTVLGTGQVSLVTTTTIPVVVMGGQTQTTADVTTPGQPGVFGQHPPPAQPPSYVQQNRPPQAAAAQHPYSAVKEASPTLYPPAVTTQPPVQGASPSVAAQPPVQGAPTAVTTQPPVQGASPSVATQPPVQAAPPTQ